jgi:hypothetical protein
MDEVIENTEPAMLGWEGAFNARDLGGFATDLGITQVGALLRSGHLAWLTDAGRRQLLASGVRTVVDLRMPAERDREPTPELPGVRFRLLPLIPQADTGAVARSRPDAAAVYRYVVTERAAAVAGVVSAIAEAPPGAVLFHCQAGKDRTGIVAAVLLRLVGVSREDVVGDYLRTNQELGPFWEREEPDPVRRAERVRQTAADPQAIGAALDVVEHGGGAAAYLARHGADGRVQAAVMQRLLSG